VLNPDLFPFLLGLAAFLFTVGAAGAAASVAIAAVLVPAVLRTPGGDTATH